MSLSGYWSDLISGQSFGSSDAAQAQSDAADAALAALNQKDLDRGLLTQEQYDQSMQNIADGKLDVTGDINSGFVEGVKEGAANEVKFVTETVPDAINGTLSATVKAIFRSIPLTVWIIAAVVLFVWMGGLTLLKGRLAKR